MDFNEQLSSIKGRIETFLSQYIEEKKQSVAQDDFFLVSLLADAESVIMGGGKRLRGALLYIGYKAAGGTNQEAAIRAAAGMEFIHSYLLIHDDIMDRDALRHGVATLHERYEQFARQHFPQKDAPHFGASIAITLGDMVCAWGNDCIFGVDLPREDVQKAIQKVQAVVQRTGVGQMRDMYIEFAGNATEEEILAMYTDKTAYYSLVGPLQIGILLGGGNKELETIFERYALPLGIAFQLQDDLLGLYGNEEHLGKTVGSDITEGKFTLLIKKTLEYLNKTDQKELLRILNLGSALTADHIAWVRDQVTSTGVQQEMEKRIANYSAEAMTALREATLDEETRTFLAGLADYLNKRTH